MTTLLVANGEYLIPCSDIVACIIYFPISTTAMTRFVTVLYALITRALCVVLITGDVAVFSFYFKYMFNKYVGYFRGILKWTWEPDNYCTNTNPFSPNLTLELDKMLTNTDFT